MLYVRGDRSVAPSGSILGVNPTILRTKGTLHQGTLSAMTIPSGNVNTVVGNLYASAIDFDNLIRSGVNSFKVWDPKLLGTYNLGGYQTFTAINGYDPIPGGGSYGSGASSRIESGQAFIVSSSAGGSIKFVEAAKTSASRNVFRTSNNISQLKTRLFAISRGGSILADGNSVVFNDQGDDVDNNNVVKMKNSGENLSVWNGVELAFEARRKLYQTDTISFRISNLKQQTYKLQFIAANLNASGLSAFLEDKYTGTKTPVSLRDTTNISFTVSAISASSANGRFRILFTSGTTLPVTFALSKSLSKKPIKYRLIGRLLQRQG